ncbi:LPXTG cell wall anchor domain-containing protein [Streptomyces sp. TLI_105]|uniref:LPXTG cell wall anchor domain-containing protein n=1 Tax=Streptomyces sp. TLI_105 TaxID=1881019 RepID=UPI0008943600|nr:LPXTG cell wall anchor domain-containing protein [Streptomyces sp. TLI_105]SEC63588.1 LPXTG-motif cell wall anchor domain-containing protein [Streptomyces sp. TLI_105]
MSAARRLLLTAIAAGTLLCALWFVPTANATDQEGGARIGVTQDGSLTDDGRLAETGGRNTTAYLLGGTAFLGVGAGSVTLAMRRRGRAF